jgi:hypothetical protein
MKHNLNGKNNEIEFLCAYEMASIRFPFLLNLAPGFVKKWIAQHNVNKTVRKYKKLMTLKKTVYGRKYGFAIAERK